MTPEQRKAAARAALDNELLSIFMDEMETTAINRCVTAKPEEDALRAAMAAECRAIRSFRAKLNTALADAFAGRGAPA